MAGGHRAAVPRSSSQPTVRLCRHAALRRAIRRWDAPSGKELGQYTEPKGTTGVGFSPDGKTVALGNTDGTIRHAIHDGKELHSSRDTRPAGALVFSADGKLFASRGNADKFIRVYETASGKMVRQPPCRRRQQPGCRHRQLRRPGRWTGLGVRSRWPDHRRQPERPGGRATRRQASARHLHQHHPGLGHRQRQGDAQDHHARRPGRPGARLFARRPVARHGKRRRDGEPVRGRQRQGTCRPGPTNRREHSGGDGERAHPRRQRRCHARHQDLHHARVLARRHSSLSCAAPTTACACGRSRPRKSASSRATPAKSSARHRGRRQVDRQRQRRHHRPRLGPGRPQARAQPRPVVLAAKQLDDLWSDLGGDDAGKAGRGIRTLSAAAKHAVPFLEEHIKPAAAIDAKIVDGLIADLDSGNFQKLRDAEIAPKPSGDLESPP